MKTFTGHKTYEQIKAQCEQLGLELLDKLRKEAAADHICVSGGGGYVWFNTVNGKFWGETDQGIEFDSSSTVFENEPWFQQLLAFFYVEA